MAKMMENGTLENVHSFINKNIRIQRKEQNLRAKEISRNDENDGKLWKIMENCEKLWKIVENSRKLWKIVENYGKW